MSLLQKTSPSKVPSGGTAPGVHQRETECGRGLTKPPSPCGPRACRGGDPPSERRCMADCLEGERAQVNALYAPLPIPHWSIKERVKQLAHGLELQAGFAPQPRTGPPRHPAPKAVQGRP